MPQIQPEDIGKTGFVYATIVEAEQIRRDLTGRFPTTSAKGNKYILVLYDYDTNNILTEPMKNRGDKEMVRAYNKLIQELIDHGFKPRLHRIYTECSQALRSLLNQHDIQFQLAPPHMHRHNAAERAIQTLKNHFIAGLCSVDPNFPLRIWDRLLPQATITLNLMRQSRLNPNVSAYAQLYGHYVFNQAPMDPSGTHIISHENPKQRATWDPHGVDGWYLGPTTDHYRCYRVHINKKTDIIVDTLEFFPAKVAMPHTASKDVVIIAAQELTRALLHPEPAAPFSTIGGSQLQALMQLTTIFDAALHHASTSTPEPVLSNGTNIASSPGCRSPHHAAPVPPDTSTAVHNTLFPTHAPPRMGPRQAQSSRVSPRLAPSPRVEPSQAPSPRVIPSQDPSPTASPSQSPPAVPTTPHHLRHQQPSPMAHDTPTHRASQHTQGTTCTNLFDDFEDVVDEEEVPPQQSIHSHTARHSANVGHSMPMANTVIYPTTGANMEYRGLVSDDETFPTWDCAAATEFGILVQGGGGHIEGSNTIFFIPCSSVPRKKVTCGRFVVDVRPNKEEVHRVRLTVGENIINYDGDVSSRSADLTTSTCLWNSVISMEGAKYMCLDVHNFYLGTPMEEFEYLHIPVKLTPLEIITQYNLLPLVSDGHIYIEVQKGMYRLPQAGILANCLFATRLAPHGYQQTKTAPVLWAHDTLPVTFSLVVDAFGVKYEGMANANHLINSLEEHYTVSKYWTGGMYCGITLQWDYLHKHVDLSMPGYITSMLHTYQHPPAKRPQYAPRIWTEPAYAQCIQYAPPPDESAAASAADITRAQGSVGPLIYYAHSVDPTLIMTLSTIASRLSTATATTMDAVNHLLDYCSTKPHAAIRYFASYMQLKIHSDASYLSEPKAKSCIGGYFFLGNSKHSKCTPLSNGPLMCQSTVLKYVVSSVTEAEYGAIFVNAKTGTVTQESLREMVHPQDATELKTYNTTADRIANKTFIPKRSKAMDMRYYWIQDRIEQGQFDISWAPGDTHLGDYFTKHHSPSHHKRIRPFYIHIQADPMIRHNTKHPVLRGCVNLCTLSQTVDGPVPSMGPHPHDCIGGACEVVYQHYAPPYLSTGQSYTCNTAISKMRNTATPQYSAVRVSTMADSQL
jgi:hypothetical protein